MVGVRGAIEIEVSEWWNFVKVGMSYYEFFYNIRYVHIDHFLFAFGITQINGNSQKWDICIEFFSYFSFYYIFHVLENCIHIRLIIY